MSRVWTAEADIICVGSGVAGLTAAITATRNGDKVIVIEKRSTPGGTAVKSAGVAWLPNNAAMRAAGMPDDEQACMRYMCRYAYPARYAAEEKYFGLGEADYARLLALYRNSGPLTEMLAEAGVIKLDTFRLPQTSIDYADLLKKIDALPRDYGSEFEPNGGVRGRAVAPSGPPGLGGGAKLIDALVAWLKLARVPILTEKGVSDVILENGRVIGVEVGGEKGAQFMRARKGVIFATGGFAHNRDLVSMHLPALDGSCAVEESMGDFLTIAKKINAKLGDLSTAWNMQALLEDVTKSRLLGHGVYFPPGDAMILVNCFGNHADNEKSNYQERARIHHKFDAALPGHPNRVMFMIFDRRAIEVFGGSFPLPQNEADADYIISGADWNDLANKIAAKLPKIAPLAGEIRLSPDFGATLAETVVRFNEFAVNGADEDFHRGRDPQDEEWQPLFSRVRKGSTLNNPYPNLTMHPFAKSGPYYAIMFGTGALDTSGGPLTDDKARVLGADGGPIPGLFGAGNCIAAPTSHAYMGGGGTIGPAMTYGFIAANAAHA